MPPRILYATKPVPNESKLYALWDGSDLNGRTILLHAEQASGDTLQMIRFVRLVKERGGRIIVQCQAPLVDLLAGMEEIDEIVAQGLPVPAFDVQAPLRNLPGILDISLDTIPETGTYLHANAKLVDRWRRELAECGVRNVECDVESHAPRVAPRVAHVASAFKIGIAWQGNPALPGDGRQSIPLECFAPLSKVRGARIISLQKGAGTEQLHALADKGLLDVLHYSEHARNGVAGEFSILELGSRLDEGDALMDTAAVMKNLHLVVTADTAIAHLAGAMGVPVWLALPLAADRRWLLERDDSPWYPTMRLFRQKKSGDWRGVFDRIALELNLGHNRGSICFGLAKPPSGPIGTS
jgi:hypothetical protein